LRAVPTACVSSYGNNSGELVQVGLNHLSNVKDGFLPIDWSLIHFDVVTPINRKQAYRFEKHVSQRSKTIFTISKSFQVDHTLTTDSSTQITSLQNEFTGGFSISPDGEWIVFERSKSLEDDRQIDLWVAPIDGGNPRQIGRASC